MRYRVDGPVDLTLDKNSKHWKEQLRKAHQEGYDAAFRGDTYNPYIGDDLVQQWEDGFLLGSCDKLEVRE